MFEHARHYKSARIGASKSILHIRDSERGGDVLSL